MSKHGFRVFMVQAYRNRVKDREPEQVHVGTTTAVEVFNLLEDLHASQTIYLDPPPAPDDADEPAPLAQTITVGEIHRVNDSMLHFTVFAGEEGGHQFARHRKKKEKKMSKWSAEAGYYVAVLFPKIDADRFMIVVQTVGRRDPLRLLLRVMAERSAAAKKTAEAAQKEHRAALRAAGLERPKPVVYTKLLFRPKQAADNTYLDEILGSASSVVAEFETKVPSSASGGPEVLQRKLRITLHDEKERRLTSVVGKGWARRNRAGKPASPAEGVSELAELLASEDLMEEGEEEKYNNAKVSVKGKAGIATTIAVNTMRDAFTYPVSDGPPNVYQYYKKVSPRVEIIRAEEVLELDVIAPLEVEECLPD